MKHGFVKPGMTFSEAPRRQKEITQKVLKKNVIYCKNEKSGSL
jgi:hypothetical protein